MTVTDTPLETDVEPAPESDPPAGLAGFLGTGDYTTIGRAYIGSSLVFMVAASVLGTLIGAERISLDSLEVLGLDTFFQVFTLYRVAAVFLLVIPLLIGIATVAVPHQVGAETIAFPRAAALAFWLWLIGAALVVASYSINGGPGGGSSDGVDLWIVSFGMVLVGLLLASVCVATTVVALRAEGMALDRVPLFAWSMLVASTLWLLTLPVLVANLVLAYLDHRYGQTFFGVNQAIWPQVAWAFGQPQIYAVAIPVLGVVGGVVPAGADAGPRSHRAAMIAIGAFGVLGFGAYAQIAFSPGLVDDPLYVGMGLAAVLPLLFLGGLWADAIRRGDFGAPAWLALATVALLLLVGGAGAGAATVIEPFELIGTSWATGHFSLVVLSAAAAGFAGLHRWAPTLFGRELSNRLGLATAALLLVGAALLAVPDLVSGVLDQPEVVDGLIPRDGVEALNAVSTAGAGVVTLAALGVVASVLGAVGEQVRAKRDPGSGAG